MKGIVKGFLTIIFFLIISPVFADISVPMDIIMTMGAEKPVGNIIIKETKYGLLFIPDLHGLPPGIHGFHIHENPSCAQEGMAAGGHLDPTKSGHHLGPYNDNGHLGDLPALYVNTDGTVTLPVLAPRLHHLSAIKNHSLMIHISADNYSDEPMKLGGGGSRMICGVIA